MVKIPLFLVWIPLLITFAAQFDFAPSCAHDTIWAALGDDALGGAGNVVGLTEGFVQEDSALVGGCHLSCFVAGKILSTRRPI